MYSIALNKLINDMNLKAMATMRFEEKYPLDKINKCVSIAANFINEHCIPFFNTITNEQMILDILIEKILVRLNELDTLNIMWSILEIKIISKKLKLEEPKFIKDIRIFTNETIDDLWNMQQYEFNTMEEKFNTLKL